MCLTTPVSILSDRLHLAPLCFQVLCETDELNGIAEDAYGSLVELAFGEYEYRRHLLQTPDSSQQLAILRLLLAAVSKVRYID